MKNQTKLRARIQQIDDMLREPNITSNAIQGIIKGDRNSNMKLIAERRRIRLFVRSLLENVMRTEKMV